MKYYHEKSRDTPVMKEVDVLVIGGGPAGSAAALAAARSGADTLLLEKQGCLGGMWTSGLVNPFFDAQNKGWLVAELIERLKQNKSWREDRWLPAFDVEAMMFVLESLLLESKCRFLFFVSFTDAIVENKRVSGVVIEHKGGRQTVFAKTVIDCTGDGDVAARAGAKFESGRESDGLTQPVTLMFELDNCIGFQPMDSTELYNRMSCAIKKHGLDVKLEFAPPAAPWAIPLPRPNAVAVQATHVYRVNPLDPRDLTDAMLSGRRQVHDIVRVLRFVPGFEKALLTRTAALPGVRESRRVSGRYRLDLEDMLEGRRFPDAVTTCSFNVDIHAVNPEEEGMGGGDDNFRKIKPYQIPYRCLLPEDIEGLLVAGRCVSGSHTAHASYRVTGDCMGMGQAAGLAAAMAVEAGTVPSAIDGRKLKTTLMEKYAAFR